MRAKARQASRSVGRAASSSAPPKRRTTGTGSGTDLLGRPQNLDPVGAEAGDPIYAGFDVNGLQNLLLLVVGRVHGLADTGLAHCCDVMTISRDDSRLIATKTTPPSLIQPRTGPVLGTALGPDLDTIDPLASPIGRCCSGRDGWCASWSLRPPRSRPERPPPK
jgi:hypothetical protein